MKTVPQIFFAFSSLFLAACGTINMTNSNGGGNSAPLNLRRAYVNDPAANDSLAPALAHQGLLFVMQPGVNYGFSVNTNVTGDKLSLQVYDNYGNLTPAGVVTAITDSTGEVFNLTSTGSAASVFVGNFFPGDGVDASSRLTRVRLFNLNPTQSDSFSVHLIMVGGLPSIQNNSGAFARAFLGELISVYAAYGINLDTSSASVNPTSAPVSVQFGSTFTDLPGTRVPGAAHIYLVDSITFSDPLLGSSMEVLGFAPREVVNMYQDPESRVILSASGGTVDQLVSTTAHELGHFFGLRHPTATAVDLQNDNDLSNRDDGFASTPLCEELSKVAAKASAAGSSVTSRPYCLYVKDTYCPSDCDVSNLMFAYACMPDPATQRLLTDEQLNFFRTNLALLQR